MPDIGYQKSDIREKSLRSEIRYPKADIWNILGQLKNFRFSYLFSFHRTVLATVTEKYTRLYTHQIQKRMRLFIYLCSAKITYWFKYTYAYRAVNSYINIQKRTSGNTSLECRARPSGLERIPKSVYR